jgi:DNA-binding NtrC family response regulator
VDRKAILIVDDEKNIRVTLARSLESLALPILTAVNGEEAVGKLLEGRVGLVLLDLKMPGTHGLNVLRRIREDWPGIPVIIITAHGTIEAAVEAMKLGAADFVQKPFSPGEVRELAVRVLERETWDETAGTDHRALIEIAKRQIADKELGAAHVTVRRAIEMRGENLEAQRFYRAALHLDPTFKPARANLDRTTSWSASGPIEM